MHPETKGKKMYAYLNGILSEKTSDTVVIDCNGIGFELKIPLSSYELLPDINEFIKLYVYNLQNDEGTKLFGFLNKQEKELFKLLININRIGPKLGLAILSSMTMQELIKAIVSGNPKTIAKTPGLGTKSAERLIIELKDKIEQISELDLEMNKDSYSQSTNTNIQESIWIEVETALLSLGYKSFEIKKALQNTDIGNYMTTEEILKICIKYIYLKRNDS